MGKLRDQSVSRLAIGPANSAGQAYAWANATKDFADFEAFSFGSSHRLFPTRRTTGSFGYTVDRLLPHERIRGPLRDFAIRRALRSSTHCAIDGFRSLRGKANSGISIDDIKWLEARNKTVALIAHGSEIRSPDIHAGLSAGSYFHSASETFVRQFREISKRNIDLVNSIPNQVFVSTPDLITYVPDAYWLPLVHCGPIEDSPLRSYPSVPRVVHLPSRRTPPIKGTPFIEEVLSRLDRMGFIEWVRVGQLPHSRVHSLFRSVDIVIDQIGSGSYGLTSVEAMAAGAVAVSELYESTLLNMGFVPPIYSCSRSDFEIRLLDLISDRSKLALLKECSLDYVKHVHSGGRSAMILSEWVSSSVA